MDSKPKPVVEAKPEDVAMEADTTEEPKAKESHSEVAKKPNKKKYKYTRGRDYQEESSDEDDYEDEEENGGEEVDKNKNGLVVSQFVAKPINIQPGHTSFLTFATLLHKDYQTF